MTISIKQDPAFMKKHISKTMFSLLEKKGFNDITVFSLCEKANISRTTFYLHFHDKYDLMYFTIREFLKPLQEKIYKGDIKGGIYMLLTQLETYVQPMSNLLTFEGNDELKRSVDIILVQPIIDYYNFLEKQGVVFKIPITILSSYHCGGFCSVTTWWLINNMPIPKEEMLQYLLTLINSPIPKQ